MEKAGWARNDGQLLFAVRQSRGRMCVPGIAARGRCGEARRERGGVAASPVGVARCRSRLASGVATPWSRGARGGARERGGGAIFLPPALSRRGGCCRPAAGQWRLPGVAYDAGVAGPRERPFREDVRAIGRDRMSPCLSMRFKNARPGPLITPAIK
jgi:hypothetical protein